MFERNRIDNIEHNGVPVEITTESGEVLTGRLLIAMGRTLGDVLNGPGAFLELEPYGGDRVFLAKAAVRAIKPRNVPKVPSLKGRLAMHDGFDPHAILGLPADAGFADIKAAWHRLAKAYHPDRFASADLPAEVLEYLDAMSRRINAAYATLEVAAKAQPRRPAAPRSEPVYTRA